MGKIQKITPSPPPLARSYLLLAFSDKDLLPQLRKELISYFGPIEYETEDYPAAHWLSSSGLTYSWIRFFSFEKLIKREELVHFRERTLKVEGLYQKRKKANSPSLPLIELDPGYLSPYTVVHTALIEDFHRIYLYAGIYAETLLRFEKHSFQPFPHTQRYFCQKEILSVFNDMRLIHLSDKS